MKYVLIALMFLLVSVAELWAGQDTNECRVTSMCPVKINGTNGTEIVIVYPASWSNQTVQVCTDLRGKYWRGLMLSEQLARSQRSGIDTLPKWVKITFKCEGVIGPRYFRVKNQ